MRKFQMAQQLLGEEKSTYSPNPFHPMVAVSNYLRLQSATKAAPQMNSGTLRMYNPANVSAPYIATPAVTCTGHPGVYMTPFGK